ncbi:MAG: hypothetical protein HGB12_14140, partial [Bacteroidetes bacterium]|nr:hypothetical protein [Bacteroidota bacterium]
MIIKILKYRKVNFLLFFTLCLSLCTFNSFSQRVAINNTGSSANVSAILDVSSTNQGMRIPRVKLLSTTDVTTIQNPVNSLLVFDSVPFGDITSAGFYYWDTASTPDQWVRLATSVGSYKDAFIVVAASNAPADIKANADYICDGTSDQTEINTALGVANCVYLTEGLFEIDGSISMASDKSLIGSGASTIIKVKDGTNGVMAIVNSNTIAGNENISVSNLRLDGNRTSCSQGRGISFITVGSGTGASAKAGANIQNLIVENFGYEGVKLDAGANSTIINNTFRNSYNGICIFNSFNNTITGNIAQGNTPESGIVIYLSSDNSVVSNIVQDNRSQGIHIYLSDNNSITGNTVKNNGNGIRLYSSSNNTISGNAVQTSISEGIYLWHASNNIITSNAIFDNGKFLPSFSGMILIDDCDHNNIQSNTLRKGNGNTHIYGIEIKTADCDSNLVANNDLHDAGITRPISDIGTGTMFYGSIDGNVGIGLTAGINSKLTVAGTVESTGLKLTTSPTAGNVLTSDASGVGTWQAPASSSKFGGTGVDGALIVSSGNTNIDLGGAQNFIKNYSSISISGTGSITFINPHSNGTTIFLKCSGDAVLTSSATP